MLPDRLRDALTFLSVYTPTYRRPTYLKICKESVRSQRAPVQHVIVEDTVGLGVEGMYSDIRNHASKVTGQYVLVLSDDNILLDSLVSRDLEHAVKAVDYPEVVIWRGRLPWSNRWFPFPWGSAPVLNQIDLSCFVVRRDIWQGNAHEWRHEYAADFYFVNKLWDDGCKFLWFAREAYVALSQSLGRSEDEMENGG